MKGQKSVDEEKLYLFRRRCCNKTVFVDVWCPGENENKVSEEELLAGEISAVTFQVGCYTVRSALRVYGIHDSDGCPCEMEDPAGKEDIEMVRKDLVWGKGDGKVSGDRGSTFMSGGNTYTYKSPFPLWRDKLRITHEISARHNSSPDKSFTYICRATNPINSKWFEYIGDIYAVKENDVVPDECASLLVYFVCMEYSHGVDTWYRFDTDRKIEIFDSN